ncbi:polyphosphate polymerase domain-containing protein [Psychrosphaera sp. B3R10]|uniref:polyphosphate polymerase domain-containing protein n=1 Tax=unclassified Psychrosphaera TaxID=2641570 RepID=UPI001C08C1D0|nr:MULTISPECIES: polyphosphate polymerase domain-containing protein [unclassified Psychrosphaera]MBU2882740.1 polyphosphate polymerase domain-containing protein [Psychrosphaera sp. I2R16]MBU2989242.1 polyphosphate polymerase domain-containing protein [Psychrosphaera sp. B3R10]
MIAVQTEQIDNTPAAPKYSDPQRNSGLSRALTLFKSHGLADLDKANLMDRVDSKFMLPISMLPKILGQIHQSYSVLEIAGKRVSTYQNEYLDTPDMRLYKDHHNGRLNRYKVRHRHYVDTDTHFIEVKFKNNKKRTIKTREKLFPKDQGFDAVMPFIKSQTRDKYNDLEIIQRGGYQRIALANEQQAERLTLDFNLWYLSTDGTKRVELPGFFIAELKQQKISKHSPFYQLMSSNNIAPTSFSKYCIGCSLLKGSTLKANRFKPTLSRLACLNMGE